MTWMSAVDQTGVGFRKSFLWFARHDLWSTDKIRRITLSSHLLVLSFLAGRGGHCTWQCSRLTPGELGGSCEVLGTELVLVTF